MKTLKGISLDKSEEMKAAERAKLKEENYLKWVRLETIERRKQDLIDNGHEPTGFFEKLDNYFRPLKKDDWMFDEQPSDLVNVRIQC